MRASGTVAVLLGACWVAACGSKHAGQPVQNSPAATAPGPFETDLAFLEQNTDVVVLAEPGSAAQVVVAPEYQGRVMTSTTGGSNAPSFGWIGRAAITAKARQPHMNVFGGEDRFWLGPEGGQYALYFKKGDPFDFEHWQVPEPIDWGRWDVASQAPTSVRFRKRVSLVNYSGTAFDIDVDRTVRLLTASDFEQHFGAAAGSALRMVAFESSNTIADAGAARGTRRRALSPSGCWGCSRHRRTRQLSFRSSQDQIRRSGPPPTTRILERCLTIG